MKFLQTFMSASRKTKNQYGIALITALLLLALLTAMSVAMFVALNSDLLTNTSYRNFRGSFYAADSGLSVVRQDLKNKVTGNLVEASSSAPPLALTGIDTAVLSSLKTAWASDTNFKSITNGTSSVDAKFRIEPSTFTLVGSCLTDTGVNCTGQTGVQSWNYTYAYHMVSIGQAGSAHQNKIEESGTLTVKVPVGVQIPGTFAGYGMYVTNQDICSGSSFAPGTIFGPVYTGGCFTFGTNGTVSFTDPVACGGNKAGYQFSGTCLKLADDEASNGSGKNKTYIKPDFQSGLYFSQTPPTLPDDSYSQKQALLDGKGTSTPSDAAWENEAAGLVSGVTGLRDINGNGYVKNASSGVYLAYDKDTNLISGGGIYVAGNASISLSTNTTGTGNLQQIYTIVNNGTTTTITYTTYPNSSWNAITPYDPPYTQTGQGTITVQSGGKTLTLNNISTSRDDYGNVLDNATLLYVNGSITSLSGQVQDDNALTITAKNDITVNGNLVYKTKPITTSDNEVLNGSCCNGLPADSVAVGNNRGQALGLFTAKGDIITTLAHSGNLEIDASMATISNGGDGGLKIPDSSAMINYLTILGGRINNSLYATSKLGQRNVYFDRRFGAKLSPPFFPAATPSGYTPPAGSTTISFHRQQWVNQTSF